MGLINSLSFVRSGLILLVLRAVFIGDIRDKKKFQNAFNECNPEFVFHMAAQPLVIESYKNPKETFDINFTGTLNLLEILKEYSKY